LKSRRRKASPIRLDRQRLKTDTPEQENQYLGAEIASLVVDSLNQLKSQATTGTKKKLVLNQELKQVIPSGQTQTIHY
jgi:hypothetical protein